MAEQRVLQKLPRIAPSGPTRPPGTGCERPAVLQGIFAKGVGGGGGGAGGGHRSHPSFKERPGAHHRRGKGEKVTSRHEGRFSGEKKTKPHTHLCLPTSYFLPSPPPPPAPPPFPFCNFSLTFQSPSPGFHLKLPDKIDQFQNGQDSGSGIPSPPPWTRAELEPEARG